MSKQYKIGTVVLNYHNFKDTISCVESLEQETYDNYAIVVVENGSNNESAAVLSERFANDARVTLLISRENLGFARGNNLGIRHAREVLGCDYVFVLNSDTLVQPGLFAQITAVDCAQVGAISPTVVDGDGLPAGPSENSDDILKRFRTLKRGLYLARFLSLPVIRSLYAAYCARKPVASPQPPAAPYGQYVLHGCAYFLTPTFFKYYTQLYPMTFLYWEEANLLLYLQKAGLHSVMIDTPPVTHFGERATKALVHSDDLSRQRLRFSFESYHNSKRLFHMTCEEIQRQFC